MKARDGWRLSKVKLQPLDNSSANCLEGHCGYVGILKCLSLVFELTKVNAHRLSLNRRCNHCVQKWAWFFWPYNSKDFARGGIVILWRKGKRSCCDGIFLWDTGVPITLQTKLRPHLGSLYRFRETMRGTRAGLSVTWNDNQMSPDVQRIALTMCETLSVMSRIRILFLLGMNPWERRNRSGKGRHHVLKQKCETQTDLVPNSDVFLNSLIWILDLWTLIYELRTCFRFFRITEQDLCNHVLVVATTVQYFIGNRMHHQLSNILFNSFNEKGNQLREEDTHIEKKRNILICRPLTVSLLL